MSIDRGKHARLTAALTKMGQAKHPFCADVEDIGRQLVANFKSKLKPDQSVFAGWSKDMGKQQMFAGFWARKHHRHPDAGEWALEGEGALDMAMIIWVTSAKLWPSFVAWAILKAARELKT